MLKRAVTEHLDGVRALELRAAEAEQRAADAEQWATLGQDELLRLQGQGQSAAPVTSAEAGDLHVRSA